jgi:hypothetical protein
MQRRPLGRRSHFDGRLSTHPNDYGRAVSDPSTCVSALGDSGLVR